MIISTKHKFCFTSCPRTGTLSMAAMLIKYFCGTKISKFHTVKIPKQYNSYYRFMIVRNPYTRLLSWWLWWSRGNDSRTEKEKGKYTNLDFKTFLLWLCENHNKSKHPGGEYQWENQTIFANIFKPKSILKVEAIDEDVLKLPFWIKGLTVKNAKAHKTTYSKPWQEFYGPEEIELVKEHSHSDFLTFGYAHEFR